MIGNDLRAAESLANAWLPRKIAPVLSRICTLGSLNAEVRNVESSFEALFFLRKYAALKIELSLASRAIDDRLNNVLFHKYIFVPINFAVCHPLLRNPAPIAIVVDIPQQHFPCSVDDISHEIRIVTRDMKKRCVLKAIDQVRCIRHTFQVAGGVVRILPDVACIVRRLDDSICCVILEIDRVPGRRNQPFKSSLLIPFQLYAMTVSIPHLEGSALRQGLRVVCLGKKERPAITAIQG